MLRRIVASCSTLFLLFASVAAAQAQALPDGCSSAYVCVEPTGGVPGATAAPANPPTGPFGISIGSNANSTGYGAVAIGGSSNATGDFATAVGPTASATGRASSAYGNNARCDGDSSVCDGAGTYAAAGTSNNTLSGVGTTTQASNTTLLGAGSTGGVGADNATGVGQGSTILAKNGTCVGAGCSIGPSGENSACIGANCTDNRPNDVSVGSDGSNGQPLDRTISNVAPGVLPTDAVNVQQLDDGLAQTLKQANLYTDQRFNILNTRINQAGATASALGLVAAGAAGNPSDNRLAMSAASYNGQSAMAFGYQRLIHNTHHPITFTVGASFSGSQHVVGAAMSFGF